MSGSIPGREEFNQWHLRIPGVDGGTFFTVYICNFSACPDLKASTEIVTTPRQLRLERGAQANLPCKVTYYPYIYKVWPKSSDILDRNQCNTNALVLGTLLFEKFSFYFIKWSEKIEMRQLNFRLLKGPEIYWKECSFLVFLAPA